MMHPTGFDALVRRLSSRRALLAGLAAIPFVPAASAAQPHSPRHKKKCKHGQTPCTDASGKRRCVDLGTDPTNCGMCGHACTADQTCQARACTGGGPTCADGRQNGSETDVDCGGETCPRCGLGQRCQVANDCQSGTCQTGRCVACTPAQVCGSDAQGTCRCDAAFPSGEPVCDAAEALGLTVDDCAKCPTGTETCVTINGLLFNCYTRCGAAG